MIAHHGTTVSSSNKELANPIEIPRRLCKTSLGYSRAPTETLHAAGLQVGHALQIAPSKGGALSPPKQHTSDAPTRLKQYRYRVCFLSVGCMVLAYLKPRSPKPGALCFADHHYHRHPTGEEDYGSLASPARLGTFATTRNEVPNHRYLHPPPRLRRPRPYRHAFSSRSCG